VSSKILGGRRPTPMLRLDAARESELSCLRFVNYSLLVPTCSLSPRTTVGRSHQPEDSQVAFMAVRLLQSLRHELVSRLVVRQQ